MGTIRTGLQRLVDDITGVTPVIGVILMVAVTVIIAAVIGSTALGLGDEVSETPPTAQIEITTVDDYHVESERGVETEVKAVVIEHTGGDNIDVDNLDVQTNGENLYSYLEYGDKDHNDNGYPGHVPPFYKIDTEFTAGDEVVLIAQTNFYEEKYEEYGFRLVPLTDRRYFTTFDESYGNYLDIYDGGDWVGTDTSIEDGADVSLVWESGDSSQQLVDHTIGES